MKFKNNLRCVLLASLVLSQIACNQEVETEIHVLNDQKLELCKSKHCLVLTEGIYPITLKFSQSGQRSKLIVYTRAERRGQEEFFINLPKPDDLLSSTTPVRMESDFIGQDFSVILNHQIELGKDSYGLVFYKDERFLDEIASAQFRLEPEKAAFDEKNQNFLASYQRVRYQQRAALVAIDADIDGLIGSPRQLEWASKSLDFVVNYVGKLLLMPWIHYRYAKVRWILGDKTEDQEYVTAKWNEVFDSSPVVDHFALVHSGNSLTRQIETENKKVNQLRLSYNSGCYSGSSSSDIINEQATSGMGHRALSASPLFSFSIIRNWTYDHDLEDATKRGVRSAENFLKTVAIGDFIAFWAKRFGTNDWESGDDIIKTSEPMLSWTDDLPPNHLFISLSAIPERPIADLNDVRESGILNIDDELILHAIN